VLDRKTDQKPGPLPDIRRVEDSIVYSLDIPGHRAHLVIRCDSNGNVTAQITSRQTQE
jgi:hypothetical protein